MLIDTVFLLKSLLEGEDRIYGVLFDGSVVTKFTGTNTDLYGYAALTEIERWIHSSRPIFYKYRMGEVSGTKQKKFFDIAFLIKLKTWIQKLSLATNRK